MIIQLVLYHIYCFKPHTFATHIWRRNENDVFGWPKLCVRSSYFNYYLLYNPTLQLLILKPNTTSYGVTKHVSLSRQAQEHKQGEYHYEIDQRRDRSELEIEKITVNVWMRNVQNWNYAVIETPVSSDFRHNFTSKIGAHNNRNASLDHFIYNKKLSIKWSRLVRFKKEAVPIWDVQFPRTCLGMEVNLPVRNRN